jgi:c-di-GMP-binding flagellar brake protein YcgR
MRLNELSLPMGKSLSLKVVGLDYKKHQVDAQLMGYVEGKSLLVMLLSKPGQILLQPGQAMSIEAQLPEGRVQFESEIEHVHDSPFLYLVLDYPLGVNFILQRQHSRIPVDTPVEITAYTSMGTTSSSIHGFMLDVSRGGARLVLEKELTSMVTKVSVGVMLESQGLERDMTIMAELRKSAEVSDNYPECGFAYGVEFIEVDPVNGLFLHCYTLQEVARGRALLC